MDWLILSTVPIYYDSADSLAEKGVYTVGRKCVKSMVISLLSLF
jgi:hypothetical protein